MKRTAAVISMLLLAGCQSVPVTMKFPEVPTELATQCAQLEKTPKTEKLSEVVIVVSRNYGKYHECSARVDAWNTWYETQKKIYESVK
jgi:hypothetical protein